MSIVKMSPKEEAELRTTFLEELGKRLRTKREHKSLSQKELGYCISQNHTAISRYEQGTRDINVSLLPLIGVYCGFSVDELFPKDYSMEILRTFSSAVQVIARRMERHLIVNREHEAGRKLKAHIYEVNGLEVVEPVTGKRETKSERVLMKEAEIIADTEPYTDMEFVHYVSVFDENSVSSVINAGQLLQQIENATQKETLKGLLADFIIDELILKPVIKNKENETFKKAYAYYQKLLNSELNSNIAPQRKGDRREHT